MQAFPHRYSATAGATTTGEVSLDSDSLPTLASLPPREFDGPGDRWSPETLLTAAVADCYVLTFRAIAAVFRLPWSSLTCRVDGTVDRVDRVTQFTEIRVRARLAVPAGTNTKDAARLLTQAKHACLVTNSFKAPVLLETTVVVRLEGAA